LQVLHTISIIAVEVLVVKKVWLSFLMQSSSSALCSKMNEVMALLE
jgi:hypothetical protein